MLLSNIIERFTISEISALFLTLVVHCFFLQVVTTMRLVNSSAVRLTYIVLDQSVARTGEEVSRVLGVLSPSAISQRLGYSVQLPATRTLACCRLAVHSSNAPFNT